MKVSQLPYERYTLEEGKKCYEQVKDLIVHAKSVDDLLAARKRCLQWSRNMQPPPRFPIAVSR